MRNFLLLICTCALALPCFATDRTDDIMSLIMLAPGVATRENVTAAIGKPAKVEESGRKSWWHYTNGTANVVICWNKRTDVLEKYSFTAVQPQKPAFDSRLYRKLRSGSTNITSAIKLLGTPQDMTVKKATQEMHYTYQKSVLRLFFRDGVLVDFTLLSQK